MKLVRYKNAVIRLDIVESFEVISLLKLSEELEIYLRIPTHRDTRDVLIGKYEAKKSSRIRSKMSKIEELYLENLVKFLEGESTKFNTEDVAKQVEKIIKGRQWKKIK
ncbi:TPA: hypothetical protein SFZ51_000744 [Campylobacter jejuni]|uniref:Uncharacterized protein n=1 Tax=Campylobacter jejuni TaxID=197 RepID=A0A431E7R3_CAMJU|nr:hypothetical protein [Campylobacter jejuni]RTJ77255.1 hypothetical protein C3H57_10335 [Campylobacter jejuni]HEG8091168.1 hypothetical protein [Campylobacter jejuni]HEG8104745.1 hypothetical protein [Campylobacter jejuni]HEG8133633.1 hypothetical protein [Campylobacter jejuni]